MNLAPHHADRCTEGRDEPYCGLCGEPMDASQASEEVRAVAGFDICAACLEEELNAPTDDERTEVGLVGRCGGRQ